MADVDFSLYLITDRFVVPGGDLLAAVDRALAGGLRAVQLREKDLPDAEFLPLAERMRALTARHGARLLINRRLEIALAVAADGVHLGAEPEAVATARDRLGPDRLIGVSTHAPEEAVAAAEAGADFVTFGPVWFTPSKAPFGAPVGLDTLRRACAASPLPVLALGGVTPTRCRELLASAADGAACVGAILAQDSPAKAVRTFLSELPRPLRSL